MAPVRLGAAAVLLTVVLAACEPSEPELTGPSADPVEAPAATGDETAIASLADPDWVARTSAVTGIPARALAAYAGADLQVRDEQGCVVGWNTLAGIGQIESQHGTIFGGRIGEDGRATDEIRGIALDGTRGTRAIADTDGGELDGDDVWDRAIGPLQFIPETWQQWGADGNGDGSEDPHHIDDAALAAARYLCGVGDSGLDDDQGWIAAVRGYNNSAQYQSDVASSAEEYARLAGR
ncbi:lytic murein transglycosylase [uncultured Aeromicrobium sp.]|uniref:lytic murein transglycosylase n=1 Tax=uncultured Aeromicrobium sp. TaxID=337820 RepID=UPI0025E927A7|nr:lytic murein transglycosylase [uncultured Aeromicrobium sp.]